MNATSLLKQRNSPHFFSVGKRKSSVAKLYLFPKGTGKMEVIVGRHENYLICQPLDYFKDAFLVQDIKTPLSLFELADKYNVVCYVRGGGLSAQASAMKLAIARALLKENLAIKPQLKEFNLLTQDNRCKERKKIGKYGARRSPQFTKR